MHTPIRRFIHYTGQPKPNNDRPRTPCLRDNSRRRLRTKQTSELVAVTGDENARMSYTVKGYARLILRHEHLLDGWPRHLHFADPSDIPGGAAPLLDLLDLWEKKILRFVKATPQDLENAARDPRSVHPNPERLSEWETEAAAAVESAQASGRSTQPTDIVSDVFHPDDLSLVGTHATSTKPAPGRHPRRQRSDTKRARFQPYTLGTTRRRSRRGMVSNPFVVSDSKDGRGAFRTTNEPIDEFKDVPTGDGSR